MENKNFETGEVMDLLKQSEFVQGAEEKAMEAQAKYGDTTEDTTNNLQRQIEWERYRKTRTVIREYDKVGRNEPCPCGSGKKYKNCCLDSGKYEGRHELTVVEQHDVKENKASYASYKKTF